MAWPNKEEVEICVKSHCRLQQDYSEVSPLLTSEATHGSMCAGLQFLLWIHVSFCLQLGEVLDQRIVFVWGVGGCQMCLFLALELVTKQYADYEILRHLINLFLKSFNWPKECPA